MSTPSMMVAVVVACYQAGISLGLGLQMNLGQLRRCAISIMVTMYSALLYVTHITVRYT